MSRNRVNNQFYVGKGYKSDKGRKPTTGAPNSNTDTYNKKDGKFKTRRRYGSDGYPVKDLDIKHNENESDHVHKWTGIHRGEHESLSKSERRELNKAKRKRRFLK